MSSFGGKNPFDDPFFTSPFGGIFGGKSPFDDPFFTHPFGRKAESNNQMKEIAIEELSSNDHPQGHAISSKEPIITLPNDNANGAHSFSFRRVAYGGLDGMYYTSSMASGSCGDGVVLVECKEEDKTKGQALLTISKGIQNKGHSVTEKHTSDGKTDILQTLHNLNEDELTGFEQDWKSNVQSYFPGYSDGFSLLEYAEASTNKWNGEASWGGWALPSTEDSGTAEGKSLSAKGRSKKVVPVNIE